MSEEVPLVSLSNDTPKTEAPSIGISRRRIAFRPLSVGPHSSTSSTQSTPVNHLEVSQSAETVNKVTRRWEHWNCSEIAAFFEGVKQFGKDFEQVAKLMARRKLNKDKDQIRNYYFNSMKLLKSTARIEEDLLAMTNIPRDARELFIVINGFEWKRKICGKFDSNKLKQLIIEGSTSVRTKKRKQLMLIRTPLCSSLQKFFPSYECQSPLPQQIVVCLTPKTEADRMFVESCGQNPLVKIQIPINDRLSQIFSLLNAKWKSYTRKLKEEHSNEKSELQLTLYPEKSTHVGSVLFKLTEATPMIFSLKRLSKELSQLVEEKAEKEKNNDQKVVEEVAKSVSKATDASDLASFGEEICSKNEPSSSFELNEAKLREGLTEDSVGEATATELYYLCGRETEIKLIYTTGSMRTGDVGPWNIFVTLMNRSYGENFCKYLGEPEISLEANPSLIPAAEERARKRRLSANSTELVTLPSKISVSSAEMAQKTAEPICAEVVEAENSAFMRQLESLQVKKRVKSFLQRRPKRCTNVQPSTVVLNKQTTEQLQFVIPNVQIHFNQYHHTDESRCTISQQPSMFSPINHSLLPGNSNIAVCEQIASCSRNRDSRNIIEKTLTDLNAVDSSTVNSFFISPTKSDGPLPDDVRCSVEMMLQQNSIDYCRNFEDLVTTIETTPMNLDSPKKISVAKVVATKKAIEMSSESVLTNMPL